MTKKSKINNNIMSKQKLLKPIHPGSILKTEFLESNGLTVEKLVQFIEISQDTLEKLIREEIPVTFKIALELGSYFDTSAKF